MSMALPPATGTTPASTPYSDCDSLDNIDRPKARAVDSGDLAAGIYSIDCCLKVSARRQESAGISVIAIRSNKHPSTGMGWCSGE